MYIDQNEIVRVRVEADEFWDDEPGPPKADSGVQVRRERTRAPFSVIVSSLMYEVFKGLRAYFGIMDSVRWLNKDLGLSLGGNPQKWKRRLWRKDEYVIDQRCVRSRCGRSIHMTCGLRNNHGLICFGSK